MRTLVISSLIAVALMSTNVSAACNQAGLNGQWNYFSNNIVLREDGTVDFTFIENCSFRVRRGSVENVSCLNDIEIAWGDTDFIVNRDCSIEASTDFCDITGQISKNKQVVSGNSTCCCYEDSPNSGNFTFVFTNTFDFVKKTAAGGAARTATVNSEAAAVEPIDLPQSPRSERGVAPIR